MADEQIAGALAEDRADAMRTAVRRDEAAQLGALALAVLLGVGILAMTGFVRLAAVHDAAHDSRHSFAFPCH